MKVVPPTKEGIESAVDALRAGAIVAYPTETVYGLAVDPFSEDALDRLYAVKGRAAREPVLLIIGDREHLGRLVSNLSAKAIEMADAFWPGPLSMLLDPAPQLPRTLLGDEGKVCVRWSSSQTAQALCIAFGGPITSTSANRSGEAPARSVSDISLSGIDVLLEGGRIENTEVSTVYDPETNTVHRAGAVTREQLDAASVS